MGDRAQLEITDGKASVFFYTHWSGHDLAAVLARGLTVGRSLKDDRSYCLGSVVREFVRSTGGLDVTASLGVGFAFKDNDDERGAPLTLDVVRKTVRFGDGPAVPVKTFLADPTGSVGWR